MATLYSDNRKSRKDTTGEPKSVIYQATTESRQQTQGDDPARADEAQQRSNRLLSKLRQLGDLKEKSDYVENFYQTYMGIDFTRRYP